MTEQEFHQLIDKYLKGTATKAEQQLIDHFFQSYEKQNSHEVSPEVGDQIWAAIQSKTGMPAEMKKTQLPTNRSFGENTSLLEKVLSLSLVVFLVVSAGILLTYQLGLLGSARGDWKTLSVQAGQKSVLNLPDGSLIHLNSGSSVSYPEEFAMDKREVILKGEAFFEVAKDPKKPFIVISGAVRTMVLGTSFNIQAYPQKEVSVTVATGKVEVKALPENGEGSPSDPAVATTTLSPGQQAVYNPEQKSLTTTTVDITRYTAWMENIIRFENATLEEAGERLSRWYGVELEFKDKKIRQCRISGQFKEQSLENVLESLAYMYHIKYQYIDKNKVLLYGKGCE